MLGLMIRATPLSRLVRLLPTLAAVWWPRWMGGGMPQDSDAGVQQRVSAEFESDEFGLQAKT